MVVAADVRRAAGVCRDLLADPVLLIETLVAYADITAAVIEVSPPERWGFHPIGMADPSGFAAMACDELLIHTDDAGRGLGRTLDTWPYPVRPDRTVLVVTYRCRVLAPEPTVAVSDEHREARWVPLDACDDLPMPNGYRASIRAATRSAGEAGNRRAAPTDHGGPDR